MNRVGALGTLIVTYQNQIELLAIISIAVIVSFIIIKAIKNARRKDRVLSEINDTVTEINAKVNKLNEKKREMIFVEHHLAKEVPSAPAEDKKDGETEEPVEQKNEEAPAEPEEQEPKTPENCKEVPVSFSSRDCPVSKKGKVFTIEELREQIKE